MTKLSNISKTTAQAVANPNQPIRTSDDLPLDHWIARQLPPGTSLRPFAEDEAITVLTSAAQEAIEHAGMTRADVARVLGTTKSYVSQVLNGSTNMTLRTFGALLWAAGKQVQRVTTAPVGSALLEEPMSVTLMFVAFSASAPSEAFALDSGGLALIEQYTAVSHTQTPMLAK